jgi:hypothetical protein
VNRLLFPLAAAGCLLVFCRFSSAGDLNIGLGYPYVSMKYDLETLAAEGRFISGSGVRAYAGRGYWNFHHSQKLKGFTGLEGGYIKFDALDITGTGYEAALFAGGEYFMTKRLSLMIDFAPTLISLRSGHTAISCVEYVANIGLSMYFNDQWSEIREWIYRLKSRDGPQRRKAASELGKLKAAEAVEPLLKLLRLWRLKGNRDEIGDTSKQSMLEILDAENARTYGTVVLALGMIGDKRALNPLIEKLEDEASYVRASAAEGLGYLGDKAAITPLETALKDSSALVRLAAAEALKKLAPEQKRVY